MMQRSLKANVAANVIGRMYTALAGILFISVYLHCLGVKSYGPFAMPNSYMAIASLLDLGVFAAITREVVNMSLSPPERMRDLIWTISLSGIAKRIL